MKRLFLDEATPAPLNRSRLLDKRFYLKGSSRLGSTGTVLGDAIA